MRQAATWSKPASAVAGQTLLPITSSTAKACPLCGGTCRDVEYRWREYKWNVCASCSAWLLTTVPEDLSLAYPDEYFGGDTAKFTGPAGWARTHFHRGRAVRIRRMLSGGGSLYDIGCGDGLFLAEAKALGFAVAGCEPEEKPRLQAEQRAGAAVSKEMFVPPSGSAFDAITCWQVIEHVDNPSLLFRKARSRLKPGGIFAVSTVNVGSWQARLFKQAWLHADPPRHLWCGTMNGVEQLLQNEGFVVESRRSNWTEFGPVGWVSSSLNALGCDRDILVQKLKSGFRGFADPNFWASAFLSPAGTVLAGIEAAVGCPATFELYCRRSE
jgi:SAM-dependent methyltransferase